MRTKHLFFICCLIMAAGCTGRKSEKAESKVEDQMLSGEQAEDASSNSDMEDAWIVEGEDTELTNTWTQDAYGDGAEGSGKDHWLDKDNNKVYKKTEIPPEFIGGNEALQEYFEANIQYSEGMEAGRVYVAFIVSDDGSIVDARVAKGVKENMDQEALRLINGMPKWDPAMKEGKPVYAVHGIPVPFKP